MNICKTIFTVEVIHSQREGEKLTPDDLAILLDESDASSFNTISIDSSEDCGNTKRIFISIACYGKERFFYVNLVTDKKNSFNTVYASDQLWLALSRVAILQKVTGVQMDPFYPNSTISVAEINEAIDKVGDYHDCQFVKVTQEDFVN